MNRILPLSILLLAASPVLAAEPDIISFIPPTTFTDGSPIPPGTVITYNIYQGIQGQPKTKITTITTTGTTVTTGLLPGTTYCFAATAIISGIEGGQNPDVADDPLTPVKEGNCKLTPLLIPGTIIVTVK